MARDRGDILENPRPTTSGGASQSEAALSIKEIERILAPLGTGKLGKVLLVDGVAFDHGRTRSKRRSPSDFA
jgi:hypothetical protein